MISSGASSGGIDPNKEKSETAPTVTWNTLTLKQRFNPFREDIEHLERANAEAALVRQLSKIDLDAKLGALGWWVLMSVYYEHTWQWNGWVWIKPTDKGWIENIALFSGEPNGHCGFIKLLSVEELKALIVKEAEDL